MHFCVAQVGYNKMNVCAYSLGLNGQRPAINYLSLAFINAVRNTGLILLFVLLFSGASAQYCGSTDTINCVTTNVPDSNGLYPRVDSFPPLFNNFLTSATIYFRNFDSILFGTEVLPVYSLTWDTIENLPPGLCWSTNKSNNTYGRGEAGCIHIRGLACGPTGQYKLSTLVTVDIGILVESDGDPGGLGYLIRLQNYGDSIIAVDTLQTDSMPFIPYGQICQNLTPLIINLGPDQTVCAGSIVTFNPVITGGQAPYTYLWQSFGSNIICTSCANASVVVTESSTYILKAIDASGQYGYDTINYAVTGTAYNFQITAPEPTTFCGGGVVTVTGNPIDSVAFQWYNGSQSLAGADSSSLTVINTSGSYYLLYTENGGCQATSNIINLVFYDTTAVNVVSQGLDTICVGASVTLTANAAGSGLSYEWLADDTSLDYTEVSFSAAAAGFYQVIVTNAVGCSDTSAGVLVVASPNLPPTLTYAQFTNDTLCNNAAAIALSGGEPDGGYYSGTGVSGGTFYPPSALQGLNFIYYNYTDSTGCGNSIADTIDVLFCTAIQQINVAEDLHIFPNPATDYLAVQSDIFQHGNISISVYDITGKRLPINYYRNSNNQVSVNISSLSAGYYLIQLTTDNQQFSSRFIKMD